MKRINVAHLRSSGGFYGAERVIVNLIRQSQMNGINNYLFVLISNKRNSEDFLSEIIELKISSEFIPCKMQLDIKPILAIRKQLIENKISILHCHDYKADIYGILASVGLKLKLVSTNHLWTHSGLKLRLYEIIDGIFLNLFSRIVAVSKQIADEIKPFLFDKNKLTIIHNGVDTKIFKKCADGRAADLKESLGFNAEDIIIGNVARLYPEKDQATLLKAFSQLIKTDMPLPNIKLVLVGDGPCRVALESLACDLDISNRVFFMGIRSDVDKIYSVMSIFVLSSLREGMPMAVLEAISSGIPVISTPAGGIPSIVHNEITGWLVNFKDYLAMSKAMQSILENATNNEKIVTEARQLVEKSFSVNTMAQTYSTLYKQLTAYS